eukprot:6173926-Pleurochrysis_carterae.AAC.8
MAAHASPIVPANRTRLRDNNFSSLSMAARRHRQQRAAIGPVAAAGPSSKSKPMQLNPGSFAILCSAQADANSEPTEIRLLRRVLNLHDIDADGKLQETRPVRKLICTFKKHMVDT